jgi:hypothetical protein
MRAEAKVGELKQFIFKIYKRSFRYYNETAFFYINFFHLILSVKEIYLCSLKKSVP